MKQKVLLIGSIILLSISSFGQNYTMIESVGSPEEYNYTTSGTNLLVAPSDDVLSAWSSLPFSFDFYGQAVTGYYASDNGYITFDNSATVSEPSNIAIPSSSSPNNAIYAYWEDFSIEAASAKVRSFNYGVAPNRTHVIQWYYAKGPVSTSWAYFAILLHECGDFKIVQNHGWQGASLTGTIGCENFDGTIGIQTSTSPNTPFPVVGSQQPDDVVYSFSWDPIQYDLTISDLNLDKYVLIGNNTVAGTITNNGSLPITSFDLHYTIDAGTAQTMNVTGVNISAYNGTYAFSHNDLWNVSSGGVHHELCVWADNLNGTNSDQRTCNDQVCKDLYSHTGTSGDITILIEETTGSWCGFCPDGTVIMEQLIADNPGEVYGLSIHQGDDMVFNDGIISHFQVSGYPSGLINRNLFVGESKVPISRQYWEENVNNLIGSYTPVNVTMEHTYNPTTREISMTVAADFTDFTEGDLRFVTMIIEDSVTGTGSGYDQTNYFSSQSSSAGGASHPFYNLPSPIIGYPHDHVLRALPGGTFGNQGIIPSVLVSGSQYSENFTYTIPATMNPEHISIIGFLANYGPTIADKSILDVTHQHLNHQVGLNEENSNITAIKLFPNPAGNYATLVFNSSEITKTKIEIFDAYGKKVSSIGESKIIGDQSIKIDLSELKMGVYYISIITEKGDTYTRKLTVLK